MKFILIVFLMCIGTYSLAAQDLYTCKNANISLFSSAPLEDIAANTSTGTSVYNASTGELVFSVNISSFRFKKSLMQEHFNSDYMESDKYPKASFKGKVQQPIDATKNGSFPVTVTGELDIHGIKQIRTIPGSITINNGNITMASEFMVKCVDHRIDIPKIVFHNIAETIKMNVSATYTPVKKS